MKRSRRWSILPLAAVATVAATVGVALAQAPAPAAPAAPAPAASDTAKPAPTARDRAFLQAMEKVEANDVAGALQALEPLRKDPQGLPPNVLSVMGALYLEGKRPQDALAILQPLAALPDAPAPVLYNAGRAAAALGKAGEAKKYFEQSLAKEPASPASRELGLILAREGRVVEAYRRLRPWAIRSPSDGEARLTAAILALQLERPEEAEELLAGQPQDDPAIRLLRGKLLVQKGDGKGALAALEPLQAKHPAEMDLELRHTTAEARLLANQPAEAVKLLQGKAAGRPALAVTLARAQRLAGDAAGALATLQPFAAKLPADAKGVGDPRPAAAVALEYGRLLAATGKAAEAVPYLEKATQLNPRSKDAFQALGETLAAAGRADEAKPALEMAKEIADAQARARAEAAAAAQQAAQARAAAQAQAQAGKAPAAGQAPPAGETPTAAAVAEMSPAMQEVLRHMAAGDKAKALEAVRRQIKAEPKDLTARAVEIRLLLIDQRLTEAMQAAEAALRIAPENADAVYQRGAVAMALKQLPKAEQDFRRALEIAPNHLAAMSDLAVLLAAQKKNAEAERLWRRVLEINPRDPNAAANLAKLKEGP